MTRVLKLRPIVHATPTATGLHVRGWRSSFSADGGPGLIKVWQWLSAALHDGLPDGRLPPSDASPAVVRALHTLLDHLREHDMVVEVPEDWDQTGIGGWLESVAADPATARNLLRALTVRLTGGGPVAAAASRALSNAEVSVTHTNGTHADTVALEAGQVCVAALCGQECGFVTAPGSWAEVTGETKAIAARLGMTDPAGLGMTEPTEPSPVLAALVGGALAHRLICATAGLTDPAVEAALLAGDTPFPTAVLVARLDPLRATYHPWLGRSVAATERQAAGSVERLLALVCDPELGPLPRPHAGELPQLPAALARAGDFLGVGVTADAARLCAALHAAEALWRADVGLDIRHAQGVALRRAVFAAGQIGEPVREAEWASDTAARHWWKALTLRLGVRATARVSRLGPHAVQAEIVAGQQVLAWAVEATAADAVALAALAATGVIQAGGQPGSVLLTGAISLEPPDDTREDNLQRDLRAHGLSTSEPYLEVGGLVVCRSAKP